MEDNKAVTNIKLINIIRDIQKGIKQEELFWEELLKSSFLCPVKLNNDIVQKNIRLENEEEISLLSLENEYGKHFLMVYTDWNELFKWNQYSEQDALVLDYADISKLVSKECSPYAGIVINPFGENVVLEKQLIINSNFNKYIMKDETIMIGIPKEYPEHMLDKLRNYFVLNNNVDEAYLLWMVHNNENSYLLVMDSLVSQNKLFPLIGEICKPFLKENILDMVMMDTKLGKMAIKGHIPFYKK